LFVLNPFLFTKENETNIIPRIKYFSLEQSKEDKIKEVRSFLLFYKYGITISPDYVDSIYSGKILDDKVERIIKSDEFLQWFEDFENTVDYIDFTKNPFGIYKHIREYAHKVGYYVDKEGNRMDMSLPRRIDSKGYRITEDDRIALETFNKSVGHYVQNNEDEYHIIIADHMRLLSVERDLDERRNLENFSSNYVMSMRDRWNFIPVLVAQQAAAQESVENAKADRLRPSADGIGIAKNIQQDCDTLIGLFSPARHRKLSWEGYDIAQLKDKHRELSIILNRRGNSVTTQLYFNGAASYFKELPTTDLMTANVYEKIKKDDVNTKNTFKGPLPPTE